MLNKTQKNSPCDFTEQTVSHFYDEATAAEKADFEAHLTNCSDCTDEFAGFGFVRSSLMEWRDEEFFKLETPVFKIPTTKTLSQTVESDSRSWFSDFRKMFSFNPMTATAVLAILIVCAGLVFFAVNSSKNSEMAELDTKNSEKIVASPTVVNVNEEPKEEMIAQDNSEKSLPGKSSKIADIEPRDLQSLPIREKQLVPSNSVVRVSDKMKNNSEKSETIPNLKAANKENKKSTTMQKRQIPNLMILDDDEDKSVRLADLFEQVGTK